MLAAVKAAMIDDRPASAEACIDWARLQFEDHFTNQIKQLLYNFPPDQMNSHGAKFWSGPKRCPHPLQFDSNNVRKLKNIDIHFEFKNFDKIHNFSKSIF